MGRACGHADRQCAAAACRSGRHLRATDCSVCGPCRLSAAAGSTGRPPARWSAAGGGPAGRGEKHAGADERDLSEQRRCDVIDPTRSGPDRTPATAARRPLPAVRGFEQSLVAVLS